MAATLMQIKSAMLLPRTEGEQLGVEDLSDPRAELVRQLLEYKKFKDAANLLAAAADEQGERFARPDTIIEQLKGDSEPTVDLDQISVWDLLEAFDAIMEATGAQFDISHITDDTPIDLYQIEILHRLQMEGPMSFERIFESRESRLALVGLFLAILELMKAQLIWAEQTSLPTTCGDRQGTGQILLRALTNTPAEEAVRQAILVVEAANQASTEPQAKVAQQNKPPIPIEEIPADGGVNQSAGTLEPLSGETNETPQQPK